MTVFAVVDAVSRAHVGCPQRATGLKGLWVPSEPQLHRVRALGTCCVL